jgi:hypothetical protein
VLPVWFQVSLLVPFGHFLPARMIFAAPVFLATHAVMVPSLEVSELAAIAPPPSAMKTATVAITFA